MNTARGWHSATLLASGKVLIAGGATDGQQTNVLVSAEIYDPSTGAFTATGNMMMPPGVRSWSTLLPDGRVFIAGSNNAEIYDPATGAFSLTGPYGNPTLLVDTAAVLPDGKIMVVGCAANCSTAAGGELFDPNSDTFSPTGARVAWSSTSTATLLTSGSVLLVEGNDMAQPDDAEIYDPVSGTFAHIGNTHDAHEYSTATRLANGSVLIAGGQLAGGAGSAAVEIYTPETGTFTPAANLSTGRHNHTATPLADGTVLIAGGYDTWTWPSVNPSASAELYK
jgi:hypothetical protein